MRDGLTVRLGAWWLVVSTVGRKEVAVALRQPVDLLAGFAQTVLMVVIFSLAAKTFAPAGDGGASTRSAMAGVQMYGFLVFIFFTEALSTAAWSLRTEQKQGTYDQLFVSPASPSAELVARLAFPLLSTGLLCVVCGIVMRAVIGEVPHANLPALALIFCFTLAGILGLGFAFAGLTLRLGETAPTLFTALQIAFLVLCAPFFPFSALPKWLHAAAACVPLSHAIDALRAGAMDYRPGFPELASPTTGMAIVVAFGALMPSAGLWCYGRARRWARVHGRLSDY